MNGAPRGSPLQAAFDRSDFRAAVHVTLSAMEVDRRSFAVVSTTQL